MITINNKSRYFSASEDMFPTMERNFAWLFGMQTPEQGWKAAMAKAIYRSARASSAEEWQYGFPIGDDGEPMLIEDDFLADLMAAYLQSHTTVPVVWRYDVLRSQARQNPERLLYYKTDTHWNSIGALIGLDGIFEALDMQTLSPDAYPVEADGTTTGDMANVAALYASLPAEETYTVPGYAQLFEKDGRAVRVIGDSFSEYYMPYLQARFTNSWREHIDTFTMDMVDHPGCDILILEFNERSLDKLLAILEAF